MNPSAPRPRWRWLVALLVLLLAMGGAAWWFAQRDAVRSVYFLAYDVTTFTLAPVPRPLPDPRGDPAAFARSALAALTEGPRASEEADGLSSAVPEATRLLAASLENERLTVDLTRAFTSGGGSASMRGRLEQVRWTFTEPGGITSVRLLVEGEPLELLGGEGLIVEPTWTRDDETLPRW